MPMTEKIRIAMLKTGVSVKDLADRLGCSSQNLSGKFKRDNFCEKDLANIAEAMGCRFEGRFVKKDTGEEL